MSKISERSAATSSSWLRYYLSWSKPHVACASLNDEAAGWVEGLLKGSGLLLLHQDALWQSIDEWLTGLPADTFTEVLPLLRRTFSTFPPAERRQMGERVCQGNVRGQIPDLEAKSGELDLDRAAAIVPLLAQLLGVS